MGWLEKMTRRKRIEARPGEAAETAAAGGNHAILNFSEEARAAKNASYLDLGS